MKYLKIYELITGSNYIKCYWIAPREYVGLALQKINVEARRLFLDKNDINKLESFTGKDMLIIKNADSSFEWFYKDISILKNLHDKNYKFMGKIEVDPEEVQLYKNSKKFGL